jgi:hypothetical protein
MHLKQCCRHRVDKNIVEGPEKKILTTSGKILENVDKIKKNTIFFLFKILNI